MTTKQNKAIRRDHMSSEKYNQLRRIFQSSDELNNTLETKYNQNLEHQVSKYTQFLDVAKTHQKELDPQDEIVGLHLSNDKIPFHFERGDTIGISLANTVFSEQAKQSEEYVIYLEQQNNQLIKEIEDKHEVNGKLEIYINEVNKRIEQDEGPKDLMGELVEQVQDEKIRYRKLRKILRQLIQEYE